MSEKLFSNNNEALNLEQVEKAKSWEAEQNAQDDADVKGDSSVPQDVYPTTVSVSAEDSSVFELKRQYEKERINLAPDYQPGNPQQNAYVERYNRTIRYDWLTQNLFDNLEEVQHGATA